MAEQFDQNSAPMLIKSLRLVVKVEFVLLNLYCLKIENPSLGQLDGGAK